jgi:hypothetical protein
MRKLPVFLAMAAAIGGTASMVLLALGPHGGSTLTFGALSSARRFARQSRQS